MLHADCCGYNPVFVLERRYENLTCEAIVEWERLRSSWLRTLPRYTEKTWRNILHLNEFLEPRIIHRQNSLDPATVKSRVSLEEVVIQYLGEPKKRYGEISWFSCPWHGVDSTPSLKVNEERGIWYCFGCAEGSDVFGFIMKQEGLDFSQALKVLSAAV